MSALWNGFTDYLHAFLFGMAAGGATVMHPGTGLCPRSDVERLHAELVASRAT